MTSEVFMTGGFRLLAFFIFMLTGAAVMV